MKSHRSYLNAVQRYQSQPNSAEQIFTGLRGYDDNFVVVSGGEATGDRVHPVPIEFIRERFWYGTGTCMSLDSSLSPNGVIVRGNLGSYPALFFNDSTSVDPNLWNRCVSKLNDKTRGSLDLAVDLAEAGQTRAMISNALRVVKYVRSFSPRELREYWRDFQYATKVLKKDPRNLANGIGSKWLEFQYGWKPLAQTVYDIGNNLPAQLPNYFVVRERVKNVDHFFADGSFPCQGLTASYRAVVHRETRVEIGGRGRFRPNALAFWSGYSSLNPLSLAWELTPYSFVVDWFIDIGGYMRNLETACIFSTMWDSAFGYATYTSRSVSDVNSTLTVGNPFSGYTYTDMVGKNVLHWKKREVLASWPVPRVPRFNADLGSGRLFNAAALLSQHLRPRTHVNYNRFYGK